MACNLSIDQLEQHLDRVMCTVEGMDRKFLPTSAKCQYVDNATRREIRVQLSRFPLMRIADKASHVDKPLSLELRLGDLSQGEDASRAGSSAAAAAESLVLTATLPRRFRLASAPFPGPDFTLEPDSVSVFRNTTADKPSEV